MSITAYTQIPLYDVNVALTSYCPLLDATPPVFASIASDQPETTLNYYLVTCSYDPFTFRTITSLSDFQSTFLNPAIQTNLLIDKNQIPYQEASTFACGQGSTTCLYGATGCSMFLDSGDLGDYCRNWAESNPQASDTAKINYCKFHPTSDCGCLRRGLDPDYTIFRENLPDYVFDSCYYIPCDLFSAKTLKLSTDYTIPGCPPPTTMCELVSNVYDENVDNLSENVYNTIFCLAPDEVMGGPVATSINATQPPPPITIPRIQTTSVHFTTSGDALLISFYFVIIILSVLLILGILFFTVYR